MSTTKLDLGAGISNTVKKPYPPGTPVQHGEYSQVSRILALGSYFISGCMAINASQFLGAPLYLINKNWYNAWIAFTKQSFGLLTMTMTQCWAPTVIRASGDKSVRGELLQTVDGNLLCNFPQRLVLIANHQIYTDWMYLWYIAYTAGMHGRIYIVLKESLKRIPVIGWGMQFSQFIFLKRNWEKDKPHMAAHLRKLNKLLDPMWLMIFPEGTNLATCTREVSRKYAEKRGIRDMQHQLLPRSTGLQFCLQELRKTVDFVYDCTIAYEGVPRGEYAQDIFTLQASYVEGRPPKSVNLYWRRFAISSIPIDDSKAFEIWLRNRWTEKDMLLEYFHRTGHFPADVGVDKTLDGKTRRGAGYIETEIKAFRWYEFMQIFAPIGLFALVLYTFYGSLPGTFLKFLNKPAVLERIGNVTQGRIKQQEKKLLMAPASKVSNAASKKAATMQKPASKEGTIRKAPVTGTNAQKALTVGPSSKQGQVIMAKKQQKTSAQLKGLKTKQKLTSPPPKLGLRQDVNSTSKKLAVKPGVTSAPKKLEPKKLEPRKLEPKKLVPKKLEPKKLDVKKSAAADSETPRAPKKLEMKQKTTPSLRGPDTKQNKPQALKTLETRS